MQEKGEMLVQWAARVLIALGVVAVVAGGVLIAWLRLQLQTL